MSATDPISLADIRAAHDRIRDHIHRTPVLTSATLDALTGARLFFKCENLQKVGAFKARGAANAVFSLSAAEAAPGVATHSSGNHAAALARAARLRGVPAYIVMPRNAPKAKVDSVVRQGGQITFCEPTLAARESTTAAIIARTGATLIHPFNDLRVITGQATAAVELLEDIPDLDVIIAPVGGGGLLAGTALAAKALRSGISVIGGEPAVADDAARSFAAGKIIPLASTNTIADGLRTSLGDLTFPIVHRHVAAIATASEAGIIAATRQLWEVMKIIVEPSGAVPLAALHENPAHFAGRRVGLILSGGNIDLDHLPWQTPGA